MIVRDAWMGSPLQIPIDPIVLDVLMALQKLVALMLVALNVQMVSLPIVIDLIARAVGMEKKLYLVVPIVLNAWMDKKPKKIVPTVLNV
jgi:hypothetical protein